MGTVHSTSVTPVPTRTTSGRTDPEHPVYNPGVRPFYLSPGYPLPKLLVCLRGPGGALDLSVHIPKFRWMPSLCEHSYTPDVKSTM